MSCLSGESSGNVGESSGEGGNDLCLSRNLPEGLQPVQWGINAAVGCLRASLASRPGGEGKVDVHGRTTSKSSRLAAGSKSISVCVAPTQLLLAPGRWRNTMSWCRSVGREGT